MRHVHSACPPFYLPGFRTKMQSEGECAVCVFRVEELKSVQPPQAVPGEGQGVNYSSHTGTANVGPWRGTGPFIKDLATGEADINGEWARTKLELTGLQGLERRRRSRKCASSEWKEKELVCGWGGCGVGGNWDLEGMKDIGVFERQCLHLTWPWGPIMGLLGLCGGGCAWGDCWEPGGPFKKEERYQRGGAKRGGGYTWRN